MSVARQIQSGEEKMRLERVYLSHVGGFSKTSSQNLHILVGNTAVLDDWSRRQRDGSAVCSFSVCVSFLLPACLWARVLVRWLPPTVHRRVVGRRVSWRLETDRMTLGIQVRASRAPVCRRLSWGSVFSYLLLHTSASWGHKKEVIPPMTAAAGESQQPSLTCLQSLFLLVAFLEGWLCSRTARRASDGLEPVPIPVPV